MARLSRLEDNFGQGYRDAFEDLATHIFCVALDLRHAPRRRKNMAGIEADPVEVGGRSFAYQAKYYDEATDISARKDDLVKAVRAARESGATDLVLFLNRRLTQNSKTKGKPAWEQAVEEEARGKDGEAVVNLDWWDLSVMETTLDLPRFAHVRDMFLGGPRGEDGIVGFYRDSCERFLGDEGGELYGRVPLSECYIEPTVDVKGEGGDWLTAREWVESFVDGDEAVAVLCGEPGHGKTSLCRKAVADFHRASWLVGRVSNVFCFSLNPANTDALANGRLNLYSLLSWGGDRTDPDHKIKAEQCRGALVFLDGFDELLEWRPGLDLAGFVRDHVLPFRRETGARVVITTRSMVVEPNANILRLGRRTSIPILRLKPISREQQLGWIDRYVRYLRGKSADYPEPLLPSKETEIGNELAELELYAEQYGELDEDADFQQVLGVPIIFRMVVAARYLPKAGESVTLIYDDLFEATWNRHAHVDADPSWDMCEKTKACLSRHALRVYADDADTAAVDGADKSPWTFSFYTAHKKSGGTGGKSRVGFLHRSFYQHFLAREVLSWFERFASNEDDEAAFRDNLSYLARRRLDGTTLDYIRDTHGGVEDKETLAAAFDKAYAVLKETDGFMPLPKDGRDAALIKAVVPLERANNVFWNVVSVCSICGHELTADKVNVQAVKLYDLTNCHLGNAQLKGIDLREARLARANLEGVNLEGTFLDMADLSEACLRRANLTDARFYDARLTSANLKHALMQGAYLRLTNLGWANLDDACLRSVDLSNSDLRGAKLRKACLTAANLSEANVCGAHLEKADLTWAVFVGANFDGATLKGAKLFHTRFTSREELKKAETEGVVYRDAAIFEEDG